MIDKEYTIGQFIKSNKSFYNALYSTGYPSIDFYIKIELLILYYRYNLSSISQLSPSKQNIIYNLLDGKYTISHNQIILSNQNIPLSYLINLINEIKTINKNGKIAKIIPFIAIKNTSEDSPKKEKNAENIIHLKKIQNSFNYTFKERSYIFEMTQRVDQDTLPFINANQNKINNKISTLIEKILLENYQNYTSFEISLLYTFISFYPFLEYAKEKYEPYLSELNINQSIIGLTKSTYNEPEISNLLAKIILLDQKQRQLSERIEYLSINPRNKFKIDSLKKQIKESKNIQQETLIDFYLQTRSPFIYNKNLLQYIMKSIYQSNIYINYSYDDPIIKFYYINNKKVEFYCAIHLSTLINLIDYNILSLPEKDSQLKLEVKNE
ncbi:MAG TPA: hypothetical protein IAC02_09110 [Candidatus Coprovivens excrementavium]|nr:hypothetical protein [Candidatus Coprovivens excrementavium]